MGPGRTRRHRRPNKRRLTTRRQGRERRCAPRKAEMVTERLCDVAINCGGLWVWRRDLSCPAVFDAPQGPENSPDSPLLSEEVLFRCHAGQRRAPPWPRVKHSLLYSRELMPGEVHRLTGGLMVTLKMCGVQGEGGKAAKQLFTAMLGL